MNPRAALRKAFYGSLHEALVRTQRRDGAAGARWPESVVVTGFFGEGFGIGRAAELTAAALEARGFDVIRHEARPALQKRMPFTGEVPGPADAAWLLQINPPELLMMLTFMDPARTPKGPRIGYWAWELTQAPRFWARAAGLVDQVWAISDYTASSFRRSGGVLAQRTRHAPHPLRPEDIGAVRSQRRFLVQADGRSSLGRKNPAGAISAFRKAFPAGGAELVVKTQHLSERQRSGLAAAIGKGEGVSWIDGSIPQPQMDALFDSVDAVISAHRSEGFGLALAEAALRGRAPVATGWSGNMDFMASAPELLLPYAMTPVPKSDEAYGGFAGPGVDWAEPDLEAAAETLQRLVATPEAAGAGLAAVRSALVRLEARWDAIRPGAALDDAFAASRTGAEERNMF